MVSAFWCVPIFSAAGMCIPPEGGSTSSYAVEKFESMSSRTTFVPVRRRESSSAWMNEKGAPAYAESVAEEFLDPGNLRVRQVVILLRVGHVSRLQRRGSLGYVHLHALRRRSDV